MAIENCEIILDNQQSTVAYRPGQVVSGRVELNCKSAKKIHGVQIKFRGTANTEWSHDKSVIIGRKRVSLIIVYRGYREYFNQNYFLIGGEAADDEPLELPAGKNCYRFSYVLPPTLPTTFKTKTGCVRYFIEVIVLLRSRLPLKKTQKFQKDLPVVANVNLNQMHLCHRPETLTIANQFHKFLSRSRGDDVFTVLVKLPHTGFVPGQDIPVSLEVNNPSCVKVSKINLKLRQNVTYRSDAPEEKTVSSQTTICKLKENEIIPPNSRRTLSKNLRIPEGILPSSMVHGSDIIDVAYELNVTFVTVGAHHNVTGNLPITIGTVPLRCNGHGRTDNDDDDGLGWNMMMTLPPYDALPPAYDGPPPAYDDIDFHDTIFKSSMSPESFTMSSISSINKSINT